MAAALGEEKYGQFVQACRAFLKKPSTTFFEIQEEDVEGLRKRAGKGQLVVVEVKALPGKEDVVGSKLLKAITFLAKGLQAYGFQVYQHGWQWDKRGKAMFWFIVEKRQLPATIERQGPPVSAKQHVKAFKKKHKQTFVKGKFLWAKDKRTYREARKYLAYLLKDAYVQEKVKGISLSKA